METHVSGIIAPVGKAEVRGDRRHFRTSAIICTGLYSLIKSHLLGGCDVFEFRLKFGFNADQSVPATVLKVSVLCNPH
jgi:hypothetical protein